MRLRSCVLLASLTWWAGIGPAAALDREGAISDVFAFRSYDGGSTPRVTLVLCADPWQEPGAGPGWRPFDPDVRYDLNVDNDNDAVADVVFRFRFRTEQRLPELPQALLGVGAAGAAAPANSPAPVAPGTLVVPPRVTSFASPGLGLRQSYTVWMIRDGITTQITGAGTFFAVPPNAGPRTLDSAALFAAGTFTTNLANTKVFAGTVDDPAFADRGGLSDTFNTAVAPPVLSAAEDAASVNLASDTHSGFAVNAAAIEIPVSLLTRTGQIEPATSSAATLGVWASTSRPRLVTRRAPLPALSSGSLSQVDRRGHPLVAEWLIGAGSGVRFSLDQPANDAQFASFFLDPSLARIVNALTGGAVVIGTPPRLDLLPLVTYAPPIAAAGTPAGPVADLLRLNTGVAPTPAASASRLGLLGGDPAGYPNGRRPFDDVVDVLLRLVVGSVLAPPPGSSAAINGRLGDGVNVDDAPVATAFPYLAAGPSGRSRRHIDPGEPLCTANTGAACRP